MERKYIVFSEEHYNPLGLIRSLGENGIKPILIILRKKIKLTSKSKYISELYLVDDIESGYKLLLEKFGNYKKKPFLLTSDDTITSYLDMHYDVLKDKFIFFNAGCQGRITKYMSKEKLNFIAKKAGLNIIETFKVKKGEIPEKINFPIITKTVDSTSWGWKKNVFICSSKEELQEAYSKISAKEILLQKYVTKKNELCIDGFSINSGNDVFLSIGVNYNYILKDRYSAYMKVWSINNNELEEKIKKMLKLIKYEGIFCIEFLEGQNGKFYFLEINFRNSGWSYASTCANMPLPVFWTESMDKKEIKKSYKNLNLEPFNAIVETTDFKIRVLEKRMSIFIWIKELFKCKCKFLIGKKGDLKPLVWMIISKIKK